VKILSDPDDPQRVFRGKQAGERGKGFPEIKEAPEKRKAPVMPRPVIPKSELKPGSYYLGRCRNATVARWNAENQKFYHWRTKFGSTFVETICHREDDNGFDVFDAFEETSDPQKEIPFEES